MANTYTQIHIPLVFAVQNHQRLIAPVQREELNKYITGIVRNQRHKLLAINCMPDHAHALIGLRPDTALSDLMRDMKACSSAFVNEKKWLGGRFCWQEGFGAFSYALSDIERVVRYILQQEEHHRTKTFREEYLEVLREFQVEYECKYLFDWGNRENVEPD